MNRIPALLIMPVLAILVVLALPFALLAFCYEWASIKTGKKK